MKTKRHIGPLTLCILMSVLSISLNASQAADINPTAVYNIMKKVADWQWATIEKEGWKNDTKDWTNGTLYAGMMAWGGVSKEDTYYEKLRAVGESNNWEIGKDRHEADDYCVGQLYSLMYGLYGNPKYIADFKSLADTLVMLPHTESLEWKNKIDYREWAWCDALFMGPPALAYLTAATGDPKYLDKASKLWWKTTDYLYDPEEHLYYRDSRFFEKREQNGKKVFWSRGNGWVMGGLVGMLSVMPEDHPDRERSEDLLRTMSAKIIKLQQPDGTWRASLLDPDAYPAKETSGTGFFCYALAWGINNGILDYQTYGKATLDAWQALVDAVHGDGKLGFVQPQGASPDAVTYEDTEVYGVGAFLLAGTEMLELSARFDTAEPSVSQGGEDRAIAVSALYKIAYPVIHNLANGTLKKNMPLELGPGYYADAAEISCLEALGRTIAGIAPWLALPDDDSEEGTMRKQLKREAISALTNAANTNSPDYIDFRTVDRQPIVDAAYLAHAFIRARGQLWEPLDETTKQQYITSFKSLRSRSGAYNNWLLFAGITETFLLSIGEQYDPARIQFARNKMEEWYMGDGWYSDGPHFSMDYYNSFVIHPMLVDMMRVLVVHGHAGQADYEKALKRMVRYAEFQERIIAPNGTFPLFGRSMAYRTGAFQVLAQTALIKHLPEGIKPGQVRAAMTGVIGQLYAGNQNFDNSGWLVLGFNGHQPEVADAYTSTGSLYMATLGFLALGLPANDIYWTSPREPWTAIRAWSGKAISRDYKVSY